MPDDEHRDFPVRVSGLLRGADLSGAGTLGLMEDAIVLTLARGVFTLHVATLDGLAVRAHGVELYLATGDVLSVDGTPDATRMAREVARHAYALPEMTVSLRALGSRRGGDEREQARFFAPLLEARRRGERLTDANARARAFAATALRAAVDQLLSDLATERHRRRPPERRALEAELQECLDPLGPRFEALERAERSLHEADDTVRLAYWRVWVAALREVFITADACWLALRPVLERTRPPVGRWRRWIHWGALVGIGMRLLCPPSRGLPRQPCTPAPFRTEAAPIGASECPGPGRAGA